MFQRASGLVISGGTFVNEANHTSRGMDLLMEWVATGAFHNSDELYDAPKCHPHTRIAVLEDIMQRVGKSESEKDDFMLWLFGPAGAGKSAIAKRIAELAAEKGLLMATFFFSRTDSNRSIKDRLVATLAYQLALTIPDTWTHIDNTIKRDPAIFNKNIQTQINALLINPLKSISSTHIQKLIIIDGLDECTDSRSQLAILDAFSSSFLNQNVPIILLIVSRPEPHIVTAFNCYEPLKSTHSRLALDDTYKPDDDIRLFFSDKFEHIKRTHPLRSTSIPVSWPTQKTLETLVKKSSGQFIYAATVVRFVESIYHRPTSRLDTILGISPPGKLNPFAELDAFYNHILSSVDDIPLTLRVLSLYALTPHFASSVHVASMSPELFLSLDQGDIHLALINLSSIISYDETSGDVKILHASFVDFLSDKRRSTIYYIDMPSICTDFARRLLQCVKGPDGIQAGNFFLFMALKSDLLIDHIPKGQLKSDIFNFDLVAFIKAAVTGRCHRVPVLGRGLQIQASAPALESFSIWMKVLHMCLDDEDKKEALDRCNESFDSQIQIYLSDWRLRLLFAFTASEFVKDLDQNPLYELTSGLPACRIIDILLEMDDHNIHLLDQGALDLRHEHLRWPHNPELIEMTSHYVNGDRNALAALHCMRFLSDPPEYSDSARHYSSQIGLLRYAEWKATCYLALAKLAALLQKANPSRELVQILNNHDMHLTVQEKFFREHVLIDIHIIAFLSRATMCVNWRIISLIRRALLINDRLPSKFAGEKELPDLTKIRDLRRIVRLDQCCANVHYNM